MLVELGTIYSAYSYLTPCVRYVEYGWNINSKNFKSKSNEIKNYIRNICMEHHVYLIIVKIYEKNNLIDVRSLYVDKSIWKNLRTDAISMIIDEIKNMDDSAKEKPSTYDEYEKFINSKMCSILDKYFI